MLSHEYWSALCPLTPVFRKMGLNFKIHLQFKHDLEPNTFRNLKLATKVSLGKYVEVVQHDVENEKLHYLIFAQKWG